MEELKKETEQLDPEQSVECSNCGTIWNKTVTCPNCGNVRVNNFCAKCGAKL